jgi:hypothetical protein
MQADPMGCSVYKYDVRNMAPYKNELLNRNYTCHSCNVMFTRAPVLAINAHNTSVFLLLNMAVRFLSPYSLSDIHFK